MQESIGFLLDDTARLYRRDFNARNRESGVTALQWRLLVRIGRTPGIRQGPLADLIEVEPITLSRMVDRLAEGRLIQRRADPADRRAWRLFLTARAKALLAGMREIADQQAELATCGLSADERARLTDLVERVRLNLSRRIVD